MAIGLGKMFGFDFPENFDYPYISKSVKEFWRRWHISLSQWFRDYVYIPLGGSRHNTGRTYLNLFIVWILTGFWHGASWNFIFWGLYYFIFLILERGKWGRILEKLPRFFQHIYTILVFTFGWVFFRADGIMQALKYIRNLFCFSSTMWLDFINVVDRKCIFCILTGIVFAAPIMPLLKRKLESKFEIVYTTLVFMTFLVAIAFLMGAGFSPFVYFRF